MDQLPNWGSDLPSTISAMMTTKRRLSSFQAGDTVLTSYGAGVIVEVAQVQDQFLCSDSDHRYSVRLWRIPNRSVGSSSLARLQSSAILSHIPVAPGMLTYLETSGLESEGSGSRRKLVMVHCYYQNRGSFLVTEVKRELSDNSTRSSLLMNTPPSALLLSHGVSSLQYLEVKSDQLANVAPSAKFYPILESLMIRADQAASLTDQFLRSDTTKRIVDSTDKLFKDNLHKIADMGTPPNTVELTSLSDDVESMLKKAAPQVEESMKQVMSIIKDEEITVLLQKCKSRLEQLSSTDLSVATREALQKTGIYMRLESEDNSTSNLVQTMDVSRKSALDAVQELLVLVQREDLTNVRNELTQNFATVFDSLAKAAKSDRGLNEIFETISDKTAAWQEATGRFMTTRSASLFLEGASRIQARAVAIFGHGQFQVIGEIGSKLTKSFSEGDAALARLKSIQLGEAVKNRLVKAIEVRSESLGGLDGIIAGALSTLKISGETQSRIPALLDSLQRGAGTAAANAQETLITVLSSRSIYRDSVLLRLEQTLCDLGDQFADELSPEEIAAVVRGEGGTARIFEPIARRAIKQIEKQLDAAESQVTDGAVLAVLRRVRKITSGELTLAAIMDDIINVLNDDKVVAAGESLVRQSEQVLDVIEGVSANKAVSDAIQIAEKAGITKESVLREFEKLKMDDLLGVAEKAVTDEKARRKLLSSATDAALDFVLRILPSMPVPPFEGVRDGLVYHISNLSMKGFKVKKEDIQIELAGMRATRRGLSRKMTDFSESENGHNSYPSIQKSYSADSEYSGRIDIEDSRRSVKATELLIIDIQNTSAVLDNAMWSFEQTYMPYLKGGGVANVRMSGGSIRLQFELRKKRTSNSNSDDNRRKWEPVLCLHDRSCTISNVDLSLEGDGTLTWLVNKIATIFKSPLRDYVVSVIVKVLSNRSGWILERLNKILSPYWDLILRTAQLDMDNLAETTDDVIVSEPLSSDHLFVELVWRERLPLGMNLLMNDDSGLLKVVDFPRGSQARVVCERRGFDPEAFKGATIVAVNGSVYEDQDELFDSLKDPGRPKTIRFKLPDTEDAERLRKFLDGYKQTTDVAVKPRDFCLRKVLFENEGELGIEFKPSIDNVGLVVSGFVEGEGGIVLAAERSGDVRIGDLLTHVNDEPVIRDDGLSVAITMLESNANNRPLQLTFVESFVSQIKIKKVAEGPGIDCSGGPTELVLEEALDNGKRRVVIKGLNNVSGMAERGGVLIGDHLVFVNGLPVGAGCRWLDAPSAPTLKEVLNMLNNEAFYPIGLTFARRQKQRVPRWTLASDDAFSDSEAETICVTADSQERIGILLDQLDIGDIVVTDFTAVPGVFQRAIGASCISKSEFISLSIEAINDEFVPSYATKELVLNALNRSWKCNETTQLILCDDELKKWLSSNL